MALQDDRWALDRIRSHNDIAECVSFRVEIDGVIHRLVRIVTQNNTRPWHALCGLSHFGVGMGLHDDREVNCVGCMAEGG